MRRSQIIGSVFALVVVVTGIVLVWRFGRDRAAGQPGVLDTGAAPDGATARPIDIPAPLTSAVHDRSLRNAVRERIYQRAGQTPPDPGGVPRRVGVAPTSSERPAQDSSFGTLDAAYIQQVFRSDFYPMARQCYESALASNPNLGGRLVVYFTIVGDDKVGGIVESVQIDEGTTIDDLKLRECFTESIMTVAFKAPPKRGRMSVRYPFTLSPGDGGGSREQP
jgi:hypothetical protein